MLCARVVTGWRSAGMITQSGYWCFYFVPKIVVSVTAAASKLFSKIGLQSRFKHSRSQNAIVSLAPLLIRRQCQTAIPFVDKRKTEQTRELSLAPVSGRHREQKMPS